MRQTGQKGVLNVNMNDFGRKVASASAAKAAIDAFASNQIDGVHFCPRCGRFTVKERLSSNALSRCAQVYVCDACGMDEAIRAMKGDEPLLEDWAVAKHSPVRSIS